MEKWINNSQTNTGLLLKASDETIATYKKFISGDDSSWSSKTPLLSITYYPASRLGLEDYWNYDQHPLVDGYSYTNLTSGNNIIQYTDFSVEGQGDSSLEFMRTYNSKAVENSPFGFGWTFTGNESVLEVHDKNQIVYSDSDGTAHTFDYDSLTNLYVSPKGKHLKISKVSQGYEITDKYGYKTYFEKDPSDRHTNVTTAKIRHQENLRGKRITYKYDTQGRLSNISDPSGRSLNFTYNANGKVQRLEFEGRKFEYKYDAKNRLIEVLQYQTSTDYTKTKYEYNNDGRLTAITDPNGHRTDYTYNQEFLQKVQEPSHDGTLPDPVNRPGTTYTYDILNNISTMTEPAEPNTTTFYSNNNYVVTKLEDAEGQVTQFELDDDYNHIKITDSKENNTLQSFDDKGNLLSITDSELNKTSYTYDSLGNLILETDPVGNVTTHQYNSYGDLISTKDPKGNTTSFLYDSYGNLTSQKNPDGSTENYGYDEKHNYVINQTDIAGNIISNTTDSVGNTTSVTDAKGSLTSYQYDNKNQLTEVTDAQLKKTIYEYDKSGNRLKMVNAKNNSTSYVYNGMNLPTEIRNSLNQTIKHDYDENGNPTKVTFPSTDEVSYTYTKLNQLKETRINGVKQWDYTYDENGNVVTITDSNQQSKFYTYNSRNLLSKITEGQHIKEYQYNPNQYLTSLKAKVGEATFSLGFIPNELNQLETLKRNDNTLSTYKYNQMNLIESMTFSNGTNTNFEYDTANRVKILTTNSPTGDILSQLSYSYDKNNYISNVETNYGKIAYQYDQLNQLTQESLVDGSTIKYEYDSVGNRTKKIIIKEATTDITSYTYDEADQLTSVNDVEYQYDSNGNLIYDGSKTYVYDGLNQLIEVKNSLNQTLAKYDYDESGNRTSKTTSTGIVYFHYHDDKVIYETDSNNSILAEYTWDDNGLPVTMTKNGKTYYYHLNAHGDVISITNSTGSKVAEYQYDAWGNILTQSGTMASINPYRYAGYRYDTETNLYYLQSRYYNSKDGRFTTRDAFHGFEEEPISQNLYTYTKNNPVMYVDHDGHNPVLILAVIVIRGLTKKFGSKVALSAYKSIKPWLKKVRNEPRKYKIKVEEPNYKGKFSIKVFKKGKSTPIFRLEFHHENGRWDLHYHEGTRRKSLWRSKKIR
ncbi:RHS repeat-associated core domain-containing protein [Halobacillus dabanensis]|uniref:RHS repeat-associated core domain-containing protein n=1 Tax=Halobacillus dabanensis TaxID=240302 RepID=A0A1I3THD5_HALDA|nr:RHS repeat-associated core domain-containing protein [Halobacillus dabanensis]